MAIRPASREAMYPLYYVVARIHGIGALGENLDLKRARSPAGRLKCLIPPACALHQARADRFWRTPVDEVLNRLDRQARLRAGRVLLDQTMPQDEFFIQRRPERGSIVAIVKWEITGARVIAPRCVSWVRQFQE